MATATTAIDETLRRLISYGDDANDMILNAAAGLADELLDQPFEMGRGTLRKTLIHILAGESVWLSRMSGHPETPWFDEKQPRSVADIRGELETVRTQRAAFLAGIAAADLQTSLPYRDSRGELFTAPLQDMLVQMCTHGIHHRAQAVNMLRRLGVAPPEVDLMVLLRQPTDETA